MKAFDIIFVGGGLANTLAACRIKQRNPNLQIRLIERGKTLGGNHTWSFHQEDLCETDRDWISPFVSQQWSTQWVHFPEYSREIDCQYASIESSDLHRVASEQLGESVFLGASVVEWDRSSVFFEDGTSLSAKLVVDGTGWQGALPDSLGYQKFVGLSIRFSGPHGLSSPVIMDATVEQIDGYRFVYLLPWSETQMLVEDTYYSDQPGLRVSECEKRIRDYCERKAWVIESIERKETGCLPIPLEGESPPWDPHIVASGLRAGLFQATTGYSFPYAVRFANELSEQCGIGLESAYGRLVPFAKRVWRQNSYFRLLNRLLFRACEPSQRYKVLQRFYQLPVGLINRFYSGQLSLSDKVRILSGRPPVPILAAIRHLVPRAHSGVLATGVSNG